MTDIDQIVDYGSATFRTPGQIVIRIPENHSDLAKFADRSAPGYKQLMTSMKQLIDKPSTSQPDVQEEQPTNTTSTSESGVQSQQLTRGM